MPQEQECKTTVTEDGSLVKEYIGTCNHTAKSIIIVLRHMLTNKY